MDNLNFSLTMDNTRTVMTGLLVNNLAAIQALAWLIVRQNATSTEQANKEMQRFYTELNQMVQDITEKIFADYGSINIEEIFQPNEK